MLLISTYSVSFSQTVEPVVFVVAELILCVLYSYSLRQPLITEVSGRENCRVNIGKAEHGYTMSRDVVDLPPRLVYSFCMGTVSPKSVH